ncbi:tyramine/octopamine receptor-like [Cololabis saira]|uniref:tyramine/octopamine receptor-like n=1 Tax=Cololabis saira TaxID=129043 RepID=UPI002AD40023|nr:tyramine/octopamine receptor-like [Cololabis saira]
MKGEPAPAWDSGNVTVWEERVNIALAAANSLVLLITSVVGIAANVFVMLAVYHQRSLQTSVNALVVNLAIIDFLRCIIDCPVLLTIIMTVNQRGRVDELICDAQTASFSFSCCIQLLTLACISAERYKAIAQPFKTGQRKGRVMVLIPLMWILAILVAVFCLLFLKNSPVYVRCRGPPRGSLLSYDTIGLYVLLPLWAACFAVIIGFYTGIFAVLRSHNRKIFDEGTSVAPKGSAEDKQKEEENGNQASEQKQVPSINVAQTQAEPNPFEKLTSGEAPCCVSISSEKKSEYKNTEERSPLESERPHPVAVQAGEKAFKSEQCSLSSQKIEARASNRDAAAGVDISNTTEKKVSSNLNTAELSREGLKPDKTAKETTLPAPLDEPDSKPVLTDQKQSEQRQTKDVTPPDQATSLAPVSANDPIKPSVELEGAVCMMPSKTSKERARKKKESKMAKRAGYIILTFLLFWFPLITTILVNFIVWKNKNTQTLFILDAEILSVSIACITSLSDPIIYAAVNPQFRSEFYRMKNWVKSRFNRK